MKKVLFLFLLSFQSFSQSYKVIGIIDGDTYDILVENRPMRVRMYAIDAPERGMPFNKVAKKYLSDLIFGKMVTIVQTDNDKNGRIVAKTYLADGREASTEMLKAGYAWHFKKYDNNPRLAQLEIVARKSRLGIDIWPVFSKRFKLPKETPERIANSAWEYFSALRRFLTFIAVSNKTS